MDQGVPARGNSLGIWAADRKRSDNELPAALAVGDAGTLYARDGDGHGRIPAGIPPQGIPDALLEHHVGAKQ